MRYRVELPYGSWASYDEKGEALALDLYASEGLRLRRCENLLDDGEVIADKAVRA